jgi:hypothetical protein
MTQMILVTNLTAVAQVQPQVDTAALGQCFVQIIQFSHVSTIPSMHNTHIPFTYHWRYIILANNSII